MIKPLTKRITKSPYMIENSFLKSLSVVTPEFVYYYINQLVTFGCAYLIGTGQYGTQMSDMFMKHSTAWAVSIRIAALILAVLPLIWSFVKEYPVILPKEQKRAGHIMLTVMLAASSAIFLNVMLSMTGFVSKSDSFVKTATAQFSLPIWMGVLVYGIVTPVTEEIVHRGIIYNRLRRYYNLPIAVIFGSLLFGLSHGNLVQFVYGFLMGIIISCLYERYGAFVYPVLFHCSANTAVYVFMSIPVLRVASFSVLGIVIQLLISIGAIYLIFGTKSIDT